MFSYRFPDSNFITKIKINGSFISVYFDKENLDAFSEKYQPIFEEKKYCILSIGEGFMHDYAHDTRNKHIGFLIASKRTEEHYHIRFTPKVETQHLTELLALLNAEHLNNELKKACLDAYQTYQNTPSIERALELTKPYDYVAGSIVYNDSFLREAMPTFMQLLVDANDASGSTFTSNKQEFDLNITIEHLKIFFQNCQVIQDLTKLLADYRDKDLSIDDKLTLQQETETLLNKAQALAMPDLISAFPCAKAEIIANLTCHDFSKLYTDVALQVSGIVGATIEFKPQPKEALPCAEIPSKVQCIANSIHGFFSNIGQAISSVKMPSLNPLSINPSRISPSGYSNLPNF